MGKQITFKVSKTVTVVEQKTILDIADIACLQLHEELKERKIKISRRINSKKILLKAPDNIHHIFVHAKLDQLSEKSIGDCMSLLADEIKFTCKGNKVSFWPMLADPAASMQSIVTAAYITLAATMHFDPTSEELIRFDVMYVVLK